MQHWLTMINEDYLLGWANKGLVRRGTRLLDKQSLESWILDNDYAEAHIDNFTQTLRGEGFDALSCSCPAAGSCHHLTCFLVGLKALVTEIGDDQATSDHVPWLLESPAERNKELGKLSVTRSMRWMNQQVQADWEETATALSGTVYEQQSYRVVIPRAEDLSVAGCSCKKSKCVHVAYIALLAMRERGIDIDSSFCIDEAQRQVITAAQEWLTQLVIQGTSGVYNMLLAQGEALATELQQADLPRPAAMLAQLVDHQKQETERMLGSSVARIRRSVAAIYAVLTALQSEPLPQPLLQLTGEHRRQYSLQPLLKLTTLTADVWETDTGYVGYTVYLYSQDRHAVYHLSEARRRAVDPAWRPQDALNSAVIAGVPIKQLNKQVFTLSSAMVSRDLRLSVSEKSRVTDIKPFYIEGLLPLLQEKASLREWLQAASKDTFTVQQQRYALVRIDTVSAPEFNAYEQCWQALAVTEGLQFSVISRAPGSRSSTISTTATKALFGRWQIQNERLIFSLIAVVTDAGIQSLTGGPQWQI